MAASDRLPLWAWLFPLGAAVAAVLAWSVWCDTQTGTWLGGVLIVATGALVLALAHEALAPRPGIAGALSRWLLAILAGVLSAAAALVLAGLGYYLRCPPFG
jgi:hypothetical protein